MSAILAFCFLIIFALLLFTVSFGLRFYENQRRKKLVSMLRTVTENGEETHVNLLVDDHSKKGDDQSLIGALNIRGRISTLLSESGLDWTETRLYTMMCVTFVLGAIGSTFIPASPYMALRALVVGLVTGFLPIMYVSKKRSARIAALEAQLPDALDLPLPFHARRPCLYHQPRNGGRRDA